MSGDTRHEKPPRWLIASVQFLKVWAIVAAACLSINQIASQRTEIKKLQAALEACESCREYHEQETNQ